MALAIAALASVWVFGVHIKKLEAAFGVGLLVGFASALGGAAIARVVNAKLRHCKTLKAQFAAAFGAMRLANPLFVALAAMLALGSNASKHETDKFACGNGVDDVENVRAADVDNLLCHCICPFVQGCLF